MDELKQNGQTGIDPQSALRNSQTPMPQPDPTIGVTQLTLRDSALIVRLEGQIKYENTHAVQNLLTRALEHERPAVLALDLRTLTFVDSQGLMMLLAVHRACRSRNCRLVLHEPHINLCRLLKLTQLDMLLEVA